jgi:geranylgeranyl diphosphate synthase type I
VKFKEELQEYKNKIDKKLRYYLELELLNAQKISPENEKIIQEIINFSLRGGKRIRPILMIKGYEVCGGKVDEEIINASISIELIESFLLIHDDIIDKDDRRRGGKSLHKMITDWKRGKHFGISSAIIAGDMLSSLAFKIIIESKFSDHLKLKALQELSTSLLECFHGEFYDVVLEKKDEEEEELLKMIDLKTGSYTTKAPLIMGGILAGGSDYELSILKTYAHFLGRAFQMVDNILGIVGDPTVTGKPVGSDIKQGKKTLLILYTFKKVNQKERKFLQNAIGNRRLSDEEVVRVRELIRKTGAVEYVKERASRYKERAKEALKKMKHQEKVTFLYHLADYIVEREL